jgi:sterol desaturase/sphingolipid hydroxylase (fatty acid hydroxylase superfamily)
MDEVLVKSAVLIAAFVACLAAEHIWPLRKRKRSLAGRLAPNAVMTGLGFLVGRFAVVPVAMLAAHAAEVNGFGLLHLAPLPAGVEIVLGMLLMDATFYYWHRANHEVRVLWRFHNVHHCDPDMDVTTSFRFHPGEILYSTAFRCVQVGILGVTPWVYATYEVVFQCATMFHHGNLRLPIGLERVLNRVVVTPRMHGIHHSTVMAESNSNYSVVFRWWDALNRSLCLGVPQAAVEIGTAGYQEPAANGVGALLLAPFVAQARVRPPVREGADLGRELAA